MVVIKGLAITAGSNPSFFASIGKVHPTTFAHSTVTAIVRHTTSATITWTAGEATQWQGAYSATNNIDDATKEVVKVKKTSANMDDFFDVLFSFLN